uniref:Uncharacterized protein n=1 Tax=viral metagenome TaxID=1070528 RepID=A0A6C0DG58_9ZZZZ
MGVADNNNKRMFSADETNCNNFSATILFSQSLDMRTL